MTRLGLTSLFLVSGGKGAGPPRAELLHTAPHRGLLSTEWSGSAARPGETLWDDREEEEDAPTKQEEKMTEIKGCRSICEHLCLWLSGNLVNGGNQKEAGQSCRSGGVFPTKTLFLETFGPLRLLLIVFNSQRTTELCRGSDRVADKHSNVEGCSVTGADSLFLCVTPDHLNLHPASDWATLLCTHRNFLCLNLPEIITVTLTGLCSAQLDVSAFLSSGKCFYNGFILFIL